MGRNSSNGWLYAGIGAVAAVGAGYLVWRYALSPETKQRIKEQLRVGGRSEADGLDADFSTSPMPVARTKVVTGEIDITKPTRAGSR